MQRKAFVRAGVAILVPLMLLLLTNVVSMHAQLSTGKIEGVVRDMDTGSPLQGAQVVIEGTRLGNVTNADGYYFILNIPPGRRDITFTYTGYQKTTVAQEMILAGQTTTVNADLSSTVVQLEGITIEGESEALMPRDNTVSKQRMTTEHMQEAPATTLEDLMILEAGVQIGGEGGKSQGLRIRGGRLGEEAMVVDGVMVRNYTADPFDHTWSGGDWWHNTEESHTGQDTNPLEFSVDAVEQVDIITGGFQAEYGNAQSGIINIITREGGPRYRGSLRMTTDQQNPRTSDYGYNQWSVSVGGPLVPGVENLFFHVSGEIQGTADNFPTHADEGFRGVNQDFVDRLNQSVVNDPILSQPENAFTLEQFRIGRESYAALTGSDASLWSPPNPVRRETNWLDRTMGSGKITYAPMVGLKIIGTQNMSRNQRSYPKGSDGSGNYFYDGHVTVEDLPLRNWGNETETNIHQARARKIKSSNTLVGVDWDFLKSAERSATVMFRYHYFVNQSVNGADLEVGWERDPFLSWQKEEINFEVENYPDRWAISSIPERRLYYPDGTTRWLQSWIFETPFKAFQDNLFLLQYRYGREKQHNYKLDFDFQLNRYNRAKLGVQYSQLDNHKINPGNWNSERNYDYEFNYTPRIMALYGQNRTDLGDFVFDYGIRFDSFRPRENWGISEGNRSGEGTEPKNKHEWSPRFDVGFPVTDKAQMRFSYGAFTQVPNMSIMYSGTNDGYLDLTRTDAFEAGASYLLSDDMVLDVVTYYRDIEGNVARKQVFRDIYLFTTEQRVRGWYTPYTNRDAGNIKGMDITVRRRFANNFTFDGIYTMQFSRTTGSAPNQALSNAFSYDPSTGESQVPPDDLRPIEGDRTHMFVARGSYLFPQDYKSGTLYNTLFRNFRLYGTFNLQSGQPTGGTQNFRGTWYYNLDLRFTKSFYLGGARRFSVFTEIFNATNRKNNVGYPRNYSYEDSYIAATAPAEGWYWETPGRSEQEDTRFNADLNGDGHLSRLEATKGEIAYRMLDATINAANWGIARQIRLGAELRF